MPGDRTESLAQYVTRVIKEKDLTHDEVKHLSSGRITDGYVRGIITGKATNLSVDKLRALALGLGVSEDEIFRVARGLPPVPEGKELDTVSYDLIFDLLLVSRKNRTVAELLTEAARLSSEAQEEAVTILRFLNSRQKSPKQRKRKA